MVNILRILALTSLLAGGMAMGSADMKERMLQLHKEAAESGDFASEFALDSPYDFYLDTMFFATESTLSDEGKAIIEEASKLSDINDIEDVNQRARQHEAQCDANYNEAVAVANGYSDVEEAHYERKLVRYNEVVGSLSPADQEVIKQINLHFHGKEYPSVPLGFRFIQVKLASEFPKEYLDMYTESCKVILANRGRPFRKVVKTKTTVGDDGSSSSWTETSYTQEPE